MRILLVSLDGLQDKQFHTNLVPEHNQLGDHTHQLHSGLQHHVQQHSFHEDGNKGELAFEHAVVERLTLV